MLGMLRGLLATWPARLFFLVLAGAFALWGVANKNPFGSDSPAGLTVAGRNVPLPEVQQAYREQLAQLTHQTGQTDPSPELRGIAAQQAIERVVTQAALKAKVSDLGLAVPDSALRDAAFAMPAFQDAAGKYDRAKMLQVLREHSMTEAHFLDLLHDELGQQQLQGAVVAGTAAPDVLAKQVYAFTHERRIADVVAFPFADAPAPPAPTPQQLERWHANHPELYSTPEYRHIKAVVLTPETVAKEMTVSDAELRAGWDKHKAEFAQPERRAAQVLTGLPDEATAQKLVTQWLTGADWAAMQAAAQQAGGASIELPATAKSEFPAPELGEAAFSAPAETVATPVKTAFGWDVVRVGAVVPGGGQSFDEARDAVRQRVATEKAVDVIYDRANRIDDLLGGGTKLEDLPGDVGVAALTGTLDAQGNAPGGDKAPVPGSPELRAALAQAVFAAHPGDPAKLTAVSGNSAGYYAFELDTVTPPATKKLADVADAVRADWTADALRHTQDAAAASLVASVQDGGSLADLAAKAGLTVHRLPATGRDQPPDGVVPNLLPPLFALQPGEATMVETPTGFMVASLASIERPDPAADPTGYRAVKDSLARGLQQDFQASFAAAARDAAEPKVNAHLLADLTSGGE